MKSWKKRWKSEIDAITPELSKEVKDAPIPVNTEVTQNAGNAAVLSLNRNKIIAIAAVFAALIIALITCLCVLLPAKKSGGFLFTIEINPAVSMAADENGKVTAVTASNADADVILSADGVKQNIIGKSMQDAAVYYADCAAKLGYINFSEKGSAVRISGYSDGGANEYLNSSASALKSYFTERGAFAVVLSEEVTKEEFCTRSGVSGFASLQEGINSLSSQKVLFAERQAEGLEIEELKNLYNDSVVNGKLISVVEESLQDNLEKLKKNADDIGELISLYYEIYSHDDNPAALLKDYWEVKKYYGDKITGEFAILVGRMDTALEEYKKEYGIEITNIVQLQKAAASYAVVSVERLAEMLENFSLELFNSVSSEISEIMRLAGIAQDEIISLLELPESAEEYFTKVHGVLEAEYNDRLKKFADSYENKLPPVSQEDYQSYLAQIESEYGSLAQFWESKKN